MSTQILFVWQEKGSPHAPHLNQSKRVQIYENAREKYPLNHIGNVLNGQNREGGREQLKFQKRILLPKKIFIQESF